MPRLKRVNHPTELRKQLNRIKSMDLPMFQKQTKQTKPQPIHTVTAKTILTDQTATENPKRSQTLRKALQATNWKGEHGHCLQIGLEGAVDDLNEIASWCAEHRDRDVDLVDGFHGFRESILDGMKAQVGVHYKAPPTIQGRVRMFRVGDFTLNFPVLFLHVATTRLDDVSFVVDGIKTGTVIFGNVEAVAQILDLANQEAQPLYRTDGCIAVRIA
jgi:hypothetical protein